MTIFIQMQDGLWVSSGLFISPGVREGDNKMLTGEVGGEGNQAIRNLNVHIDRMK